MDTIKQAANTVAESVKDTVQAAGEKLGLSGHTCTEKGPCTTTHTAEVQHEKPTTTGIGEKSVGSKIEEGAEKLVHGAKETGLAAKHKVEETVTSAKNIGK